MGIKRGVEPLALAKMCCSLLRALILIKTSYTFMKKINPCANARTRTLTHTAKIWQNTAFVSPENIGFHSALVQGGSQNYEKNTTSKKNKVQKI